MVARTGIISWRLYHQDAFQHQILSVIRCEAAESFSALMRLRLYTIQKSNVLELIAEHGCYRASWRNINARGNRHIAYQHASMTMQVQGIGDGNCPPIWAWKADRPTALKLGFELLSEAELTSCAYTVIEFEAPAEFALQSSYYRWCDLYFDCIESGEIRDDRAWLNWRDAENDPDDHVQVLLPHIDKEWIISTEPFGCHHLEAPI